MRHLPAGLIIASIVPLCVADERKIDFNRDVRPILSDKCFSCHGPDAVAKKIPLRLDSEDAAKASIAGRRAIVNGDPSGSEMVRRITADRPARRMPPPYSGLKLTDPEIATLESWIAQGAVWQKHWSFNPPLRHALPALKNGSWPRNAIDRFVLERLEREALDPAPEASRETLIRRVSLDLTGLPATPAEVETFAGDPSSNAYEKIVDRLLASPRYGERMAARWLDAARYADSNGYQYDGERVMWRWRDWVIESFNRNQPFDQFAVEQIAGDLLPNATLDQKLATGFNRNHRANTEDGIIAEEYAVEYVVDRVETTSTVFLGLTLGCARCHNHKYDPFTQKEFYRFFAYFNNVPELGRAMKYGNSPPVVAAPTADQQRALREMEDRIGAVSRLLDERGASIEKAQRDWERLAAASVQEHWSPSSGLTASFSFDNESLTAKAGTLGMSPGRIGRAGSFDGKTYIDAGNTGNFDIEDRFTLSAWIYADQTPAGSVITRMADNPRGKGYGVHVLNGKLHFNLTSNWDSDALRVETEKTLGAKRWHHVLVAYRGSRMAEGATVYIDGQAAPVKVLLDTLYRPFRNAGKAFTEPFRIGAGMGPKYRFQGLIDDVRIYNRILAADEISALAASAPIGEIAGKPHAQRSVPERNQLKWYFLDRAAGPEIRDARQRLLSLQREKESLERTFPTAMVMAESSVPKSTHLLIRGAYDKPGEKVEPGVPQILHGLPQAVPNNRLGLAKWLVDPANPLTARVAVNRFWQMYFGSGLVKTTEDFGLQGDSPSHPELLDWMATEFQRTHWDVKAMQKLIVMSAAYRQSSKTPQELLQRDPENRLLARGPRQRLPAEMVRDQALYAAGLLFEKLGGPSVKPYQPDGLWQELAMQDMDYNRSKGGDLYRRGLYTFWKRTIPPPMMMNFDAANREACVVSESRTNTPLQALNLMNDVTFLEAARAIAQRMVKEGGGGAAARLRYGFKLVTARTPSAAEQQVLDASLNYHRGYFADEAKAAEFLKQGDLPADPGVPPSELAAYTSVASLMLNLDEAVTKE